MKNQCLCFEELSCFEYLYSVVRYCQFDNSDFSYHVGNVLSYYNDYCKIWINHYYWWQNHYLLCWLPGSNRTSWKLAQGQLQPDLAKIRPVEEQLQRFLSFANFYSLLLAWPLPTLPLPGPLGAFIILPLYSSCWKWTPQTQESVWSPLNEMLVPTRLIPVLISHVWQNI